MIRLGFYALIPAVFAAGLLAGRVTQSADAASAGLQPQIIDIGALTDAKLAVVPHVGALRSKTLVATPNGTISVQSGDVPKHMHLGSDEIQYVLSGSATFWLGSQQRHIHPGDLIIIPRGTAHAGSHTLSGELKVISIKLPPQAPGDMHLLK